MHLYALIVRKMAILKKVIYQTLNILINLRKVMNELKNIAQNTIKTLKQTMFQDCLINIRL